EINLMAHKREQDKKNAWKQILTLLDARDEGAWFITISRHVVYLYRLKPDSPLSDLSPDLYKKHDKEMERLGAKRSKTYWKDGSTDKDDQKIELDSLDNIPKYIDIDESSLHVMPISKVPALIVGIAGSQKYNRNTIKIVDSKAHKDAIKTVFLEKPIMAPYFDCLPWYLGSTEYETLLAKILEVSGLHVFSRRGGTIPTIDITARNYSDHVIEIANLNKDLKVQPGQIVTFQVKREVMPVDKVFKLFDEYNNAKEILEAWTRKKGNESLKNEDFFVVVLDIKEPDTKQAIERFNAIKHKIIKARDIMEQIKILKPAHPEFLKWLGEELHWIPGINNILSQS
ncbi:MAG: hypothetical protein ACTSRA_02755, partial [Promethearchaeota archaeon]